MPHRFHALVKIRRDRRTPVVRLSGEPPRDPNQSSAPPVIDYNRLTPGICVDSGAYLLYYLR